jgi:hypothetical protein
LKVKRPLCLIYCSEEQKKFLTWKKVAQTSSNKENILKQVAATVKKRN